MRRFILPICAAIAVAVAAATAQQPQGPGQLRPRPGTGREPEFPRRRSPTTSPSQRWLFPQHPVPRAKFPVVDIHGHPPALVSPQAIQTSARCHGQVEHPGDGSGQRRLRRSPEAAARRDRGQRSQRSIRGIHERQLAQHRARLWRARGAAARSRHQGRRDGPRRDLQGPRHVRQESRRHAACKLDDPELDPVWDDGRAAEHPGVHPHRASRRRSSSRSTTTTSAGSSWRCIPIGATRTGVRFEELMAERNA